MRSSWFGLLLVTASWLPVACGGPSAPPKDEGAAAQRGSAGGPEDAGTPPAGTVATAAPAHEPSDKPSSSPSSGDLVVPTEDDPWMAPHQMSANDVVKTMRAARGKLNACWSAAKKRDPFVSGEIKIKFVVTHEGGVRVWRNEDSAVSDEGVIECVGEVIKSTQFPAQKSPGGAWAVFKINFGG